MTRIRTAVALIATTMLLSASIAAPVAASSASWSQFHYSSTRSGYNPLETTLSSSNVAHLKPIWQANLKTVALASPTVVGNQVFMETVNGMVYALRRTDGHVNWKVRAGTAIWARGAAVWGSLLLVAADDASGGQVMALNTKSGKTVWRTRLAGTAMYATPAVYGNSIYLASGGTVYDLNAASGKVIWQTVVSTSPDGAIQSPVAVSGGGQYVIAAGVDGQYVIAAGVDGQVYLLVGADGRRGWTVKAGEQIYRGGPSIYNGIIYVSAGHTLAAMQVSDGNILWQNEAGGGGLVAPAAGRGGVYLGDTSNSMRGFDAATGALRWTSELRSENWGDPVLANGLVYIATDEELEVFDTASGTMLYSYPLGSSEATMSGPAVLDGRVYVASGAGIVYAFGL